MRKGPGDRETTCFVLVFAAATGLGLLTPLAGVLGAAFCFASVLFFADRVRAFGMLLIALHCTPASTEHLKLSTRDLMGDSVSLR